MKYGYARVSSKQQSTELQVERLLAEGCQIIIEEKLSGRGIGDRVKLCDLVRGASEGDVIVCVKIDRLARSVRDVLNIAHELREKGASLQILEPAITLDASPVGAMVMTVFAMVGELELSIMKERQRAGIRKAVEAGKYKGPARKHEPGKIIALLGVGYSPHEVCEDIGCSLATVYRAVEASTKRGGAVGGYMLRSKSETLG